MKSKIAYIASYPKSGNTWIRLILSNYFFSHLAPIPINKLRDCIASDTTNGFYLQYATEKKIEFKKIINDYNLRNAALKNYLLKNPNTFLKTHSAFHTLNNISYFDTTIIGIIVYIIRDPRDIVISAAHHNLGSALFKKNKLGANGLVGDKELQFIFEQMCNSNEWLKSPSGIKTHLSAWDIHVNSFKQVSEKLHLIRYEDLLLNTDRCINELIIRIIGKSDKEKVSKAIKHSTFSNLKEDEANNSFNEKNTKYANFFREGKSGGWKNYSNSDVFKKIEKKFGSTMAEHGYL
jgi:hypothetical protein